MGLFGKKKEDKSTQSKSEQKTEKLLKEKHAAEKQPEAIQPEKKPSEEKQPETIQSEGKQEQKEMKVYIRGAGGTIVTKSILNGTSKLKWLFRQESEHGNGWVAFGDRDSQKYVDDAKNMAIVDFNTLANI